MCGRFTLRANLAILSDWFGGLAAPDLFDEGKPEAVTLKWGFLAAWAKTAKGPMQPINAKSETVGTSRLFRPALKKRRCLIPADGFYERKADRKKQPFYIHRNDETPFSFAGIWTQWDTDDESIQSCAILTKAATERPRPRRGHLTRPTETATST